MKVGIVGIGRMGKVLAEKFVEHFDVIIYDRNIDDCKICLKNMNIQVAETFLELIQAEIVILAVPDHEVINIVKEFNHVTNKLSIISIATNVSQSVLSETAKPEIKCINVKIIGHATEMALGAKPLIIVNYAPKELVDTAIELFSHVGDVRIGKADIVTVVNRIAAKAAVNAAVEIEKTLYFQGISDPEIIKIAISQVASGIVKAYAYGDLGPFAREIVRAVKTKSILN